MAKKKKTYTEAVIDGKVITFGGTEDEERLLKAAAWLNSRMDGLEKEGSYRNLDLRTKWILTGLNLSEDYIAKCAELEEAQKQIADLQNEIYGLKHDLASAQIKKEDTEKELSKAQDRLKRNRY